MKNSQFTHSERVYFRHRALYQSRRETALFEELWDARKELKGVLGECITNDEINTIDDLIDDIEIELNRRFNLLIQFMILKIRKGRF